MTCAPVMRASARPPRPKRSWARGRPRPTRQPSSPGSAPSWPPGWPPGTTRPAERAELAKAEAELTEIGYDAAAHEAVRARVQELAPFDARYGRQLLPRSMASPTRGRGGGLGCPTGPSRGGTGRRSG